jgi:phosphohistidine phosphatase
MKSLLLLRHAKSSWKDSDLEDHDRPLNKRGKRDAPRIGKLLAEERLIPDYILCSTARRARNTAEAVIEEIRFRGESRFTIDLYHADRARLVQIVHDLPDHYARVLVIGHNPGLEEFLELATGVCQPLTTAALAQIDFPIASWRDYAAGVLGKCPRVWQPRSLE